MKASTVLKKARRLIAETGHCKGELARNKYRHKVDPTSPTAVKFCAFGALQNVLGVKESDYNNTNGREEVEKISMFLGQAIPSDSGLGYSWWSVDDYNDREEITPKDVDNWFVRAIKLAEKAGN